jgi:hypothetical protein
MSTLFKEMIKKINLTSPLHKQHKEEILNKFINNNMNLAPQGSIEWHAIRKYNIGGSEMAVITGDNPYQKIDNLIAQKIGFTKFNGNLATRWGNLFEPITQGIAEIIFESGSIQETGSVPGAIKNQRYSPDGIGVVKLKCSFEDIETDEYCIVLFEYKAPFTSIPTGKIPDHYIPQVKTGLCSMPFIDFAIFISNMYRKCSFDMLKENEEYDTNFHNKDFSKKIKIEKPLAYGMILFYQTETQKKQFTDKYFQYSDFEISYDSESESDDELMDDKMDTLFNNMHVNKINVSVLYKYFNDLNCGKKPTIKDFGKSNYYEFNDLMILHDEKLISVKYLEPNILPNYRNNDFIKHQEKKYNENDVDDVLNKYIELLNTGTVKMSNDKQKEGEGVNIIDVNIMGFLPWKLFKSDIVYQEREYNYVIKHKKKIDDVISIIKKINGVEDINDKLDIFKKYFPKSKIPKKCGYDTSEYMDFIIR